MVSIRKRSAAAAPSAPSIGSDASAIAWSELEALCLMHETSSPDEAADVVDPCVDVSVDARSIGIQQIEKFTFETGACAASI